MARLRRILRLLLPCLLLVANGWAQSSADEDVLLRTLQQQVDSLYHSFDKAVDPVYLLSVRVEKVDDYHFLSAMGDDMGGSWERYARMSVQIRVGSGEIDNYYPLGDASDDACLQGKVYDIPLDGNAAAVAQVLSQATQEAYQEARARYHRVLAALRDISRPQAKRGDFVLEPAVAYYEPPVAPLIREEALRQSLSTCTRALVRTEAYECTADLHFQNLRSYLVTSDGTSIAQNNPRTLLTVTLTATADDGTPLVLPKCYERALPEELPLGEELARDVQAQEKLLEQMRRARVASAAVCPVLFEEQAATVYWQYAFVPLLLQQNPPLETQLTPAGWQVVSNPAINTFQNAVIPAAYRYDDEGQEAERVQLLENGYRHICVFEKAPVSCDYAYRLEYRGSLSDDPFAFLKKKKKRTHDIKRRYTAKVDISEYADFGTAKRLRAEFDFTVLYECLCHLLEIMEYEREIAVVCPIEMFAECCESEQFEKKLISSRSRSVHNIVVLTSSVDAADNDMYFRNPAFEYNAKNQRLAFRMFYNERLFPDVVEKFSDGFSNTPKLVHTYDALQEIFADRMEILNELSFEELRTAVGYVLMRDRMGNFRYSPDAYAAVVWAWYENEAFKEKYSFLKLPDNPFRSMRVITDYLAQNNVINAANEIIVSEKVWMMREFFNRWRYEEKSAAIVYGPAELKTGRCYPIISMLRTYKKALRGHESVLGDGGEAQLNAILKYFYKPSYTSYYNKVKLPHERFAEPENQNAILTVLNTLRQKDEWTGWDDSAMLLLYTLFEQCYLQSKTMCSIDQYNELGKSVFEKSLQAVRYCMYCSEDLPRSPEELKIFTKRANQFVTDAQRILRSGNNKRIKDFIILKGET